MILALLDYAKYRARSGRFAVGSPISAMGASFSRVLPEEVVAKLRPGSMLFVSTYDSLASWLVMYLTNSEVSHVANYVGGGRILHAVPRCGVLEEAITEIEGENSRILPCELELSEAQQDAWVAALRVHIGKRYDTKGVARKGLRILVGRDARYLSARLLGDIAICWAFVLFLDPTRTSAILLLAYLVVLLINGLKSHLRPLPFDSQTSKPVELLWWARSHRGRFFYDGEALQTQLEARGTPLVRL